MKKGPRTPRMPSGVRNGGTGNSGRTPRLPSGVANNTNRTPRGV